MINRLESGREGQLTGFDLLSIKASTIRVTGKFYNRQLNKTFLVQRVKFSTECRKTNNKENTLALANHKGHRLSSKPIKTWITWSPSKTRENACEHKRKFHNYNVTVQKPTWSLWLVVVWCGRFPAQVTANQEHSMDFCHFFIISREFFRWKLRCFQAEETFTVRCDVFLNQAIDSES